MKTFCKKKIWQQYAVKVLKISVWSYQSNFKISCPKSHLMAKHGAIHIKSIQGTKDNYITCHVLRVWFVTNIVFPTVGNPNSERLVIIDFDVCIIHSSI